MPRPSAVRFATGRKPVAIVVLKSKYQNRAAGADLAAVIPIEDLRLLERLAQEEMDRIDLEDARAALKEAEEKGTIPLRDLMRELGD